MEIKKPFYDSPFLSFRMFDDLYFVGCNPASVHILDTGKGLVLFDTGFTETLGEVVDAMWRMGLDPKKVIAVFLTHGHIDHVGGAKFFREMSGAKIYLGEQDVPAVTGEKPLIFDWELGMRFTAFFEPDVLVHDGDTFEIGGVKIYAVATPGHTEGAMSYFFPVTKDGKTYLAGLHGGMGINTMSKEYLTDHGLPFSLRDDFIRAMHRLNEEPVEVFLGNHMGHNDTAGRYRMMQQGNALAFVDPAAWVNANHWYIKNLKENMIDKENKE